MENFQGLGKFLMTIEIVIFLIGTLLMFFNKIPFLGKLPGDIIIKKDNFTFCFPIVTSIIISVILSLLFYFFSKHK